MKGLTLNLSKSGVSMTAGVPGMSVNTGRRGTYLNTGVPGTGLYDRQRVGGGGRGGAAAARRHTAYAGGTWNGYEERSFDLSLDASGNPVLKDETGSVIHDPGLLRQIRRSPDYKRQLRELSRRMHAQHEQETEAFVEIHTLTPEVPPASSWQDALSQIAPAAFEPRAFNGSPPDPERIRADLVAEAKREVRPFAFWKARRLREDYVDVRLQTRLAAEEAACTKALLDFETSEAMRRESWEEAERVRCVTERDRIKQALAGGRTFVEDAFEARIADMELPVEFSIDLDYDEKAGLLHLDIDLPEIEDLPQRKTNILKSGKVSIKDKSKRELTSQYAHCVTGLLFFFAGEAFNISPKVQKVVASGYTQRINGRTGHEEDDYVASVRFERSFFSKLNTKALQPTEAIRGFEHRFETYADGRLKTIEPL